MPQQLHVRHFDYEIRTGCFGRVRARQCQYFILTSCCFHAECLPTKKRTCVLGLFLNSLSLFDRFNRA
uniref:AlNc14C171G8019 protein n=1 Tax=Albugo laibachii Nc14 TaxID=890382 RepID=F0WEK5_9STRA|nr:AlNc14C75G5055 [Albugo laibachii Nc14]CCA22887.1 AlNc14C171G8019 [Albugo laibachii Nc14]|eukprot:CCA22887.1 AlNc14C171G8019 [Albugo laibachii Nc14]